MNLLIEGWNKELLVLLKRENILREAIKAAQKVCSHKMVQEGHDSHKDQYICTECGYEEWY